MNVSVCGITAGKLIIVVIGICANEMSTFHEVARLTVSRYFHSDVEECIHCCAYEKPNKHRCFVIHEQF